MTAGLAIETTTNVHSLPIAPWAGLGGACRVGRSGTPRRRAATAAARRVSGASKAVPGRSPWNIASWSPTVAGPVVHRLSRQGPRAYYHI